MQRKIMWLILESEKLVGDLRNFFSALSCRRPCRHQHQSNSVPLILEMVPFDLTVKAERFHLVVTLTPHTKRKGDVSLIKKIWSKMCQLQVILVFWPWPKGQLLTWQIPLEVAFFLAFQNLIFLWLCRCNTSQQNWYSFIGWKRRFAV